MRGNRVEEVDAIALLIEKVALLFGQIASIIEMLASTDVNAATRLESEDRDLS